MRSDYKVYRYDRLDAPVVTAGSAAVLIGAQNGLFPDMGLAVPGEMGGLWAGEKKVCDGFFLAIGRTPNTDLVRGKLDIDEAGYIRTQAPTTATSVAGVFAAGDVADSIYQQAINAAASGCRAAMDADRFLIDG